jgi:hypothetical protein
MKVTATIEIDIPDEDSMCEQLSRFGDTYGMIHRTAARRVVNLLPDTWGRRVRVIEAEFENDIREVLR